MVEKRPLRISIMKHFALAFLAFCIIQILTFQYLAITKYEEALRNNVQEVDERLKAAVEKWQAEKMAKLQQLAEEANRLLNDREKLQAWLVHETREFSELDAIGVADPAGWVWANSTGDNSLNVADRAYFKAALAGKTVMSEPVISRVTGSQVLVQARPLYLGGKIQGILIVTLNLEHLREILEMVNLDGDFQIYLTTATGTTIVASAERKLLDKEQSGQRLYPDWKAIMEDRLYRQVHKYQNHAGEPVVGHWSYLRKADWVLIVESNINKMADQLRLLAFEVAGISLLLLIAGIMPLFNYLSKRLTQPLEELVEATQRIAAGDYSSPVRVYSYREIEKLALAINEMMAQLQQVRAEAEATLDELQEQRGELERRNRLLEEMAITDPLTQCYNRRYVMNRLPSEVAHALRYGEPLSVIMVDVDYFKNINDTYGHLVGDEVLRQVADLLRASTRKADILGRYGGEEFIIICPSTSGSAASQLAERMRQKLAEVQVDAQGEKLLLSASFGVADLVGVPSPGDYKTMANELVNRADMALYRAKAEGRNRVVMV
ncbi:MAG: diguanylate cyclase [Bacillota bacterium]